MAIQTEKTIYTLDCLVCKWSTYQYRGDTSLNTAKRQGSTMITWKTICYHLTKPRTTTAYLPDIPQIETHTYGAQKIGPYSTELIWRYYPVMPALGRCWPDWQFMGSLCWIMRPEDSRHFSTQQTVQLLGPRTIKTNLRWKKSVKTAWESELNEEPSRVMRYCISIRLLATQANIFVKSHWDVYLKYLCTTLSKVFFK